MKKLFFLLLLLPFFSCGNFDGKSNEETQLEIRKAKIQAAYDSVLSYQLAWADAQLNLNYWVSRKVDSPEKKNLVIFLNNDIAEMKSELDRISILVGDPDVKHIIKNMDEQALIMKDIMSTLKSVSDYENPELLFPAQSRIIDEDGDAVVGFRAISNSLEILKSRLKTELRLKIKQD